MDPVTLTLAALGFEVILDAVGLPAIIAGGVIIAVEKVWDDQEKRTTAFGLKVLEKAREEAAERLEASNRETNRKWEAALGELREQYAAERDAAYRQGVQEGAQALLAHIRGGSN